MVDIIGYIALSLAPVAMMNKKVFLIRIIHLISCMFYIVFGFMSHSMPVAIGAILFSLIHIYHIYKMKIKLNPNSNEYNR